MCEAPELHTVDVAAAALLYWLNLRCAERKPSNLSIRTFDLQSAYRQVGLSKAGRAMGHICVYDPLTSKPRLFQCQVLPFGAVRSVHSFLRLARAVWWVGVVGCKVIWSSFYDDFIVLTQDALASNTEQCASLLFELTGWLYAKEGKKCMPFSKACEALGVLFDLEKTNFGKCSIRNTPARVDELVHDILERVKEGIISRLQAQRLRGRMQFAESQLFGRTARRCLQVLSAHTTSASSKLSKRDGFFLQQFAILLREGPPRVLEAETEAPLLIFTDACYERDAKQWVCGLGGVLVDPKNERRSFFSLELDDEARLALRKSCKQQIIFEAETLACLVAFCYGLRSA